MHECAKKESYLVPGPKDPEGPGTKKSRDNGNPTLHDQFYRNVMLIVKFA